MGVGAILGIVFGSIGFIILIIMFFHSVKIIPQTEVRVVERFGSYRKTLHNGLNFIAPIIDKVVIKESLKERVLDFPAQDVITKDNVMMKIDTVVYMQITDPKLYAYGVDEPISAVENMTATTLRNLVGDISLDEALVSRDTVNEKLREVLDKATDPWGIKIIRVELKNILPPEDIRKAMEKQMRAEREKRELILVAEGQRAADILKAEGEKNAAILRSEGVKESLILEAEGKKKSLLLMNEITPSKETLILKSFEAMIDVANGEATTILIPTELTEMSKFASAFSVVNNTTAESIRGTKAKKDESNTKVDAMLSELSKKTNRQKD